MRVRRNGETNFWALRAGSAISGEKAWYTVIVVGVDFARMARKDWGVAFPVIMVGVVCKYINYILDVSY